MYNGFTQSESAVEARRNLIKLNLYSAYMRRYPIQAIKTPAKPQQDAVVIKTHATLLIQDDEGEWLEAGEWERQMDAKESAQDAQDAVK